MSSIKHLISYGKINVDEVTDNLNDYRIGNDHRKSLFLFEGQQHLCTISETCKRTEDGNYDDTFTVRSYADKTSTKRCTSKLYVGTSLKEAVRISSEFVGDLVNLNTKLL
jgi:hypothetical protein